MNVLKFLMVLIMLVSSIPCFAAAEGDKAPEFKAKLFNGEDFSLTSVLGQVVILHFWATWCTPCRTEMPVLDRYYKLHKAEGLQLITINMDNPKNEVKAKELMKEFSFKGGMSRDASFKAYGRIWRLPLTFVVDRKGVLRKDGWAQDRPMTYDDLENTVTPLLKAK